MAGPFFAFNCSVCLDPKNQSKCPRSVDNNFICEGCVEEHVVPLFDKALVNELEYPVKWAGTVMPVEDYRDLLGERFVRAYQRREVEYRTPLTDRTYCKHKIILNTVRRKGEQAKTQYAVTNLFLPADIQTEECSTINLPDERVCYGCLGRLCAHCRGPLRGNDSVHACQKPAEQDTIVKEQLKDLVQGKDYQCCPNPECGQTITLRDGCNHIQCPIRSCLTEFCYVCGQQASSTSGHWMRGGCPRYNQPGQQDVAYDEENGNDVDNEGNGDEGDNEDVMDLDAPGLLPNNTFFDLHRMIGIGPRANNITHIDIDQTNDPLTEAARHEYAARAPPTWSELVQSVHFDNQVIAAIIRATRRGRNPWITPFYETLLWNLGWMRASAAERQLRGDPIETYYNFRKTNDEINEMIIDHQDEVWPHPLEVAAHVYQANVPTWLATVEAEFVANHIPVGPWPTIDFFSVPIHGSLTAQPDVNRLVVSLQYEFDRKFPTLTDLSNRMRAHGDVAGAAALEARTARLPHLLQMLRVTLPFMHISEVELARLQRLDDTYRAWLVASRRIASYELDDVVEQHLLLLAQLHRTFLALFHSVTRRMHSVLTDSIDVMHVPED